MMADFGAAFELAAPIPGWMSEEELRWLGAKAERAKVVYEVGVWQGRTTKMLAACCSGTVHAVDNFVGEEGSLVEDLEGEFRHHLQRELRSGQVTLTVRPSVETAKTLKRASADMVFIDANHVEPHPFDDIKAWWPVLRRGGLMCGHDAWMAGVEEALNKTAAATWHRAPGSIWWGLKP